MSDKAIVRQHVEKIDGVSRTWFELTLKDEMLVRTLVVEVEFDTDPNCSGFRQSVLDAIKDTAVGVLANETPMIVSDLKIVPEGRTEDPPPAWSAGGPRLGQARTK
jgi:hypothetical protein